MTTKSIMQRQFLKLLLVVGAILSTSCVRRPPDWSDDLTVPESARPWPREAPFYPLDLRHESSVKTVFDSGLRPTHRYQSGLDCEIWNRNISFRLPPDYRTDMEIEWMIFSVTAHDELLEIEAITRNLPIEQAYEIATKLMQTIGQPPIAMKQAFISARRNRRWEDVAGISIGVRGEPSFGIGFIPGDFVESDPWRLHIKIGLTVRWRNRGRRPIDLRKTPISPPPGYEDFSMAPIRSPSEIRRRAYLKSHGQPTPAYPVERSLY